MPCPGPFSGVGRGVGQGARVFRGPGGPVTNTTPLPSSGPPSRAPFVFSSGADPSQTILPLRHFLQETHDRLHFSRLQIPIPDDRQLCYLSEGETIPIPFLCSALNALKSITRQLDTLTTQMGNVQSTVVTLPTFPAMENTLSLIQVSLRSLSYKVTPTPPPAPTLAKSVVPPPSTTSRPAPRPLRPGPALLPPRHLTQGLTLTSHVTTP